MKKNIYNKFDKVDEDHKQIKDDHTRTRNDISNIKNDLDKNNKLLSTHTQQIDQLFHLIEELKNNLKNNDDAHEKAMKEQLGKIHEYINSKIKE